MADVDQENNILLLSDDKNAKKNRVSFEKGFLKNKGLFIRAGCLRPNYGVSVPKSFCLCLKEI